MPVAYVAPSAGKHIGITAELNVIGSGILIKGNVMVEVDMVGVVVFRVNVERGSKHRRVHQGINISKPHVNLQINSTEGN